MLSAKIRKASAAAEHLAKRVGSGAIVFQPAFGDEERWHVRGDADTLPRGSGETPEDALDDFLLQCMQRIRQQRETAASSLAQLDELLCPVGDD